MSAEITVNMIVKTQQGQIGRVLRVVAVKGRTFYRVAELFETRDGQLFGLGKLAFIADTDITDVRGIAADQQPAATTVESLNEAFNAAYDKLSRRADFNRRMNVKNERNVYLLGDTVLVNVRYNDGMLKNYQFPRSFYVTRYEPLHLGATDAMAEVIAIGIEAARAEIRAAVEACRMAVQQPVVMAAPEVAALVA